MYWILIVNTFVCVLYVDTPICNCICDKIDKIYQFLKFWGGWFNVKLIMNIFNVKPRASYEYRDPFIVCSKKGQNQRVLDRSPFIDDKKCFIQGWTFSRPYLSGRMKGPLPLSFSRTDRNPSRRGIPLL